MTNIQFLETGFRIKANSASSMIMMILTMTVTTALTVLNYNLPEITTIQNCIWYISFKTFSYTYFNKIWITLQIVFCDLPLSFNNKLTFFNVKTGYRGIAQICQHLFNQSPLLEYLGSSHFSLLEYFKLVFHFQIILQPLPQDKVLEMEFLDQGR